MRRDRTLMLGIGCGMAAGALWGLVFLAPELGRAFTPMQLSAGRYLAYGIASAILLRGRLRKLLPSLGRAEWSALFRLSLLGNTFYYLLLVTAVQKAGIAAASLILGFLPVVVAVVGSRDAGAVPLRKLLPSLALSLTGFGLVALQSLGHGHGGAASLSERALGLLCAVAALGSWSAYAIGNSRMLVKLSGVSAHEWSLLTGIVTGAQALFLAVPAVLQHRDKGGSYDWLTFTGLSAGVALGASVVGNAFWNKASKLLPLTMVGQLIVFETLFALLYAFVWEHRLPTLFESCAMILLGISVVLAANTHASPSEQPAAA